MHRATVGRILSAQSTPFGAQPQQDPSNLPTPSWAADQPPPPPERPEFRRGYHDRTLRAYSAPLSFEGWPIERIRNAVALHDQGFFLESSLLSIIASRFGPVFAALSQAIAPALALPRNVLGGTRGLSRMLREEVEAQLAPRAGLMPSQVFPPSLWGAVAVDLRMQGFAVLQHVYGDENPMTGVRPVYTRRWPTWAVQYYRYRRTYVAITTEGPVDIISGDGKFTLLADTEEPHFDGAIRALALEVLDGALVKQARASYIDRYGNPKWIGIMPPNTGVRTPEGDAMFEALETIQGPDGFGVIPHGSDYKTAEMSAGQSAVFKDALDNVWQFCAAIMLGSDGTMSKGTGVYSAPIFAGVRRDLVDRMLKAVVRGVNMGHVAPWLAFNYAASIDAAAGWTEPVLDIPLPDPDADARIKSYGERAKALVEQIDLERQKGFTPTQERVEQLAKAFNVEPPTLDSTAPLADWMSAQKLVAPDEVRAKVGLRPLPEGVGSVERLVEERKTGKDQISGRGVVGFDATKASALVQLGQTVGLRPSTEGVASVLYQAGLGSEPIPDGNKPAAHIELAPTDLAKIVKVDEAREANGLEPLGGDRGDKMIGELSGGAPANDDGSSEPGAPAPNGDPYGVNDGAAEAALGGPKMRVGQTKALRIGNGALVISAGSPDQQRAPDGKFGSGGTSSAREHDEPKDENPHADACSEAKQSAKDAAAEAKDLERETKALDREAARADKRAERLEERASKTDDEDVHDAAEEAREEARATHEEADELRNEALAKREEADRHADHAEILGGSPDEVESKLDSRLEDAQSKEDAAFKSLENAQSKQDALTDGDSEEVHAQADRDRVGADAAHERAVAAREFWELALSDAQERAPDNEDD